MTGGLDLAFISETLGPGVAAVAGELSAALRHSGRPVPAELWRDFSRELWTVADGDLLRHRDFRRFQNELYKRHPPSLHLLSKCRRAEPPVPVSDAYCAQGAIGKRVLKLGCYSFYECFTLAVEDIVQNGLRERVLGALSSGVTVRALLERMYGVVSEAAPSPGVTHADEARWFLRLLKRAKDS